MRNARRNGIISSEREQGPVIRGGGLEVEGVCWKLRGVKVGSDVRADCSIADLQNCLYPACCVRRRHCSRRRLADRGYMLAMMRATCWQDAAGHHTNKRYVYGGRTRACGWKRQLQYEENNCANLHHRQKCEERKMCLTSFLGMVFRMLGSVCC